VRYPGLATQGKDSVRRPGLFAGKKKPERAGAMRLGGTDGGGAGMP